MMNFEEIEEPMKYSAKLHINANDPVHVECIGTVRANSIKHLKKEARKHARSWNKHLFGRIHVEDTDKEIEFFINP